MFFMPITTSYLSMTYAIAQLEAMNSSNLMLAEDELRIRNQLEAQVASLSHEYQVECDRIDHSSIVVANEIIRKNSPFE